MIDQAILALGVFLIAFTFAPVGMGGGLIFVPLLHYVGGWSIDGALIAVSLSLTAVVSFGSGLAHRKEGHVSDAAVKSALVGAVPAALLAVSGPINPSISPVPNLSPFFENFLAIP